MLKYSYTHTPTQRGPAESASPALPSPKRYVRAGAELEAK